MDEKNPYTAPASPLDPPPRRSGREPYWLFLAMLGLLPLLVLGLLAEIDFLASAVGRPKPSERNTRVVSRTG
jgi:hypothetical protein